MQVTPSKIPDILIIDPKVFGDARGFFFESYNERRYREAGVVGAFVQDNLSFSKRGILRGLHFQKPNAQGKLVSVIKGAVLDVAVDIRVGSPYFGKWVGIELSEENHRQVFVPPGFAHGFAVLSEEALFSYKCTDLYHPEAEGTILWNDPDIGIDWGSMQNPQLSEKDRKGLRLRDFPKDRLPEYAP